MNRSKRSLLQAATLGASTVLLPGQRLAMAADPLRVGFVYVSPIGDAGWTFQHDMARKEMEKALGDKVRTKFVESVPEGADAERVIRELAQGGQRLIFTTSFGYMNPTLKVARAFPNTVFMHVTGYKTDKNVGQVNARFYEGRYLAGVIAGATSRTAIAGYVAAFPIPEVLQGINAFVRGMQSVNPKATVRVVWVNSWYDPGKEREAALALASQGADVLTHHTDSPAAVQVAEEKKIFAVGYHSDMSKYGPSAHIAAVTHNWGAYYTRVAEDVIAGRWKSGMVWGGIRDGFIKLAGIGKGVPAEIVQKVGALESGIRAGTFHPFAGPVIDQAGKTRVAAGKSLSDAELGAMNYYVQGVVGALPGK